MRAVAVAGSVVVLLFAAGRSDGMPTLLDTSALRAEITARQAGYTGRLDPMLTRKKRGLDRALAALDSPSSTLSGDLRILLWTASALDRPFATDAPLLTHLHALEEEASSLVRGAREGLAAHALTLPPGALPFDPVDRRLAAAEAAPTRRRRLRLLWKAGLALDRARAAAEAAEGVPLGGGAMLMKPVFQYTAMDYGWIADGVTALVTVDAEGVPVSLEIVMARAPGGGPVTSCLRMNVAAGFAGLGTYQPQGTFDPDMDASIQKYTIIQGSTPSTLTVTDWDPETGRIAGTFHLYFVDASNRSGPRAEEGVFEVRTPLIRHLP